MTIEEIRNLRIRDIVVYNIGGKIGKGYAAIITHYINGLDEEDVDIRVTSEDWTSVIIGAKEIVSFEHRGK